MNAPVDARIIAVCHMLGMEFTHLSHLSLYVYHSVKLFVCESTRVAPHYTVANENRGRFIINVVGRLAQKKMG